MADSKDKPQQRYRIITPTQEKIWTVPGTRGPDDMRIYSEFPKQPWATTLYYIGCILRLKGFVEDRNYPNGYGHAMLAAFFIECICHPEIPIKDLCSKYKIPIQENHLVPESHQKNRPIETEKDNANKKSLTEAVNAFWKSQGWE
jgi:hypothetical protein